jgi:hypothetical protein
VELALQLAAAFEALLTITDELGTDPELRPALADHVARLRDGRAPLRVTGGAADRPDRTAPPGARPRRQSSALAESRPGTSPTALARRVATHTAAAV